MYATDIIRSSTGYFGKVGHALSAPLSGLSSRLFCCALKCVHVLSRHCGWQDPQQQSTSSYLYVCECESVRAIHDYNVQVLRHCVEHCGQGYQEIMVPSGNTVKVSIESLRSLATVEVAMRCNRIQSVLHQKRGGIHRYTFSANEHQLRSVLESIRSDDVWTWDSTIKAKSLLQAYVPRNHVGPLLKHLAATVKGHSIRFMREATQWLLIQADAEILKLVENAIATDQKMSDAAATWTLRQITLLNPAGGQKLEIVEIGPRSKFIPHGRTCIVACVDPGLGVDSAKGFFAAMMSMQLTWCCAVLAHIHACESLYLMIRFLLSVVCAGS